MKVSVVVPTLGRWGQARKIEILGRIELFADCSKHQLAQVAAVTVQSHLDEGAVLTRQGRSGGLAYVVEQGAADVVRHGAVVATLGPGSVIGELSLLDGKPRSATVKATSPMDVLEVSSEDLAKLLAKMPSFRRKLLETLSRRVRQMDALPTAL
jgi:CRP-like cAMP-binding protein